MKKRLLNKKRFLQFVLSLCFILMSTYTSWGQLLTVNTSGPGSYTVPAGVTSITISTWGAGGAGGSAQLTSATGSSRGGGGAGGSFASTTITVTTGDVINYVVGTGGVSVLGSVNAGGDTSAILNSESTPFVKALGGPGGVSITGSANGNGGVAPTIENIGNGSLFYGGNGGTANVGGTGSGGGGGSAGTTSDGISGVALTGGIAVAGGGAGGAGTNTTGNAGTAGGNPGGGGGGGTVRNSIASKTGSNGGNGKIVITNNGVPSTSASTIAMSGFIGTTAQSFTVTGANLTSALIVNANSTDYELSTDNFDTAGEASINLGLTPTNPTTIYVRLKSGLGGGVKTATLTVETSSATTLNVVCTGGVSATYHYVGSGLLSSNTNWGTNTDGSGVNPTAVTDGYSTFVLSNTATVSTESAWTLGSNSKVIVGNGSAVSLTVANGFPIIGTIDAAANGSVVWQDVATSPTFGALDNASEVHLQPATAASYSFGATTAYGKLFIDGAGEVSVSNTASTPTVKTALTVALGSTLSFSSNASPTISINSGATATINGKIITFKATGLFVAGGSIPLNAEATLLLGVNSTIVFGRPETGQTITGLPSGSYANLILSDGKGSTAVAVKTIAAEFTVNGTLTIDLATPAFSTITGADKITLANGATVVMTSGALDAAPIFGATVNVTYNGKVAQTAGAEIPSPGLKTLTLNNTVSVTFDDLTIESGASANVLKGSLIVTGALANNGTITIDNNANLVQTAEANTNSGSGTATVKRNSNLLFRQDYTLWSSPVSGAQTLAQFSPLTSQTPNRFFSYNPGTNLYANVSPTSTFSKGSGYLIRMPNEDPKPDYNTGTATLAYPGQFTGTLNNGPIPVEVSAGYNLVGNPYPSNISFSTLQSESLGLIGTTAYFWRKTNGATGGSAYCTYNSASFTYLSNGDPVSAITFDGTIKSGQGFFVNATADGILNFTNTQRTSTTTNQAFFKTKQVAKADKLWLNATNTIGNFSQMALTYSEGATTGVDSYDSKFINDSGYSLNSNIDGGEYVIQGRPAFDATDVVALNFKTTTDGNYTIALANTEGVFATGQDIYLVDSKTGAETDLKAGAYTFTATAGADNARFSLKYQKTLNVGESVFNENSVRVHKNNGALYVKSGTVAISNIKVFDIQGRLIAEQKDVNAPSTVIKDLRVNNQVLIVKITGEDNSVVSKKVVN